MSLQNFQIAKKIVRATAMIPLHKIHIKRILQVRENFQKSCNLILNWNIAFS